MDSQSFGIRGTPNSFFSKHFKVAALDMRGFGETERPIEIDEYRIEKLVRDVIELIHSWDMKRQR